MVNTDKDIAQQQQANPAISTAQLDAYFDSLYQQLLSDPAISGLTLQVHWDTLNPNPPAAANAYAWNPVDDAFSQAAAWNNQNPTQAPKTIQLIVTPGFQSPPWMLDQLSSCDGLFATPAQTPPGTCGKVTFTGYGEGGDGTELPLPWSPAYKSAWQTFLTALAARYGSNPAFVSIAVAGPTGASAEMLLPNDSNSANPQTQFATPIAPNAMWRQLVALEYPGQAAYQNSDQAFVDAWEAAIDMYGELFSGMTLVATTGSGLPNLNSTGFTIPSAFSGDCNTPNMDCAAETTILSYFAEATAGGPNAKATQTSGMNAARVNGGNLGVASVKAALAGYGPVHGAFGADPGRVAVQHFVFERSAGRRVHQRLPTQPRATRPPPAPFRPPARGKLCPSRASQACLAPGVGPVNLTGYGTFGKVPSADLIPPEQAEYNVLNVYFNATAAGSYFGATNGSAPLNYLQIYAPDIQYAEMNVNAPAQVVVGPGITMTYSAQDLLNLASQKLLSIAEPPLLPAITTGGIVPGTIQPGEWVSIYGINLASGTATWNGDFPLSLGEPA